LYVSNILYVMSMQPILEADTLPLHKKIGITNNTVLRAAQLGTKMPFTMYVEAAWEVGDSQAGEIEGALHKLLNGSNIEGEWFEDPEETLVDGLSHLMTLLGCKAITDQALDQQDNTREGLEARYRRTEANIKQLLGSVNTALSGWVPQAARAVEQRFIRNGATLYVQPKAQGAILVTNGRNKELSDKLHELFNDRVQRSQYPNGQMREAVSITQAELQTFFAATSTQLAGAA